VSKEDDDLQRIGYGLVVIGAFLAALCIYAIWVGTTTP
jgi:hypothetical protein